MTRLYYIKQQPHSLVTFQCPKDLTSVKQNDYANVWWGEVEEDFGEVTDDKKLLEEIFRKFNFDHPKHFAGHSFSVGDIVMLCNFDEERGRTNIKNYICASFGWEELPSTK